MTLNKYNILTNAQYNFKSGKYTKTNLIHFTQFVNDKLDNNMLQ